jgi:hypothetical protein
VLKAIFLLPIITVTLLFSYLQSFAQSNLSFAIGGGAIFYNGDLSDASFVPPVEIIKPYYGGDVSLLLVDRLDLSLRYLHGSVKGDDALSDERDNLARNQSFFSKIDELNLMMRLRLFSVRSERRLNPYGMAGIGYFSFNPQATLNGKTYDLQKYGTEGQYITGGGYAKPYKLYSASLAMGLGMFITLNPQWAIRLEAAPQLTFTDYLDDVSTIYADSLELASTPNGAIAVLLASKRKRYPYKGRSRGNPDNDDVMVTVGLSVVFTPLSKNNASSKPGVFHQLFRGRKGWWGMTPD